MVDYFPLGLASGTVFCNRDKERETLYQNIKACRHTVLVSPRRYGKTSLVMQVLKENEIEHQDFNLLLISDEQSVQDEVREGIEGLLARLLPTYQRALAAIKKFFFSLKPELSISTNEIKFNLNPSTSPKKAISDMLLQLDELAHSQQKKIVLFFDEFQQLNSLHQHEQIEAAFRYAAERAKATCYIFSGSNRHFLAAMFQDSSRPFYRLCDEIHLQRIAEKNYVAHIQEAAQALWHKRLDKEVMELILNYSRRHAYTINKLCSKLWYGPTPPTSTEVTHAWQQYCHEYSSEMAADLRELSPNQRAMMRALGQHPTQSPHSNEFQSLTRLSVSSLRQAIEVLKRKDLIYQDDDGYFKPLDPVYEYLLANDA